MVIIEIARIDKVLISQRWDEIASLEFLEDIAASLGCDWRELNREKLLEWAERLLRVLMTDTLEFENFEQDWLKMERDRQVF
jgi:hypothetical protein